MALLGEPTDGEPFDDTADQLLNVFKPMAEAAIRNAVLLQEARQSQRWSEAAAGFMRDLLMGSIDEPLPRLADTALEQVVVTELRDVTFTKDTWPKDFSDVTFRQKVETVFGQAKTRQGDFPPSSSATRAMLGADCWRMRVPVVVSPVKLTLWTRGSPTSTSPTLAPGPGRTDTASAGTPASTSTSPSSRAESGV